MSFRVKVRIKRLKPLKLPAGDPDLLRRLYEAAKQVRPEPFQEWHPQWDAQRTHDWARPPGVTYLLWNGIDPINWSAVQ
jgi:hypothetical protein